MITYLRNRWGSMDYVDINALMAECDATLGGPARKMTFFQMAPKLFLSDQTHSNRCEYELYEVWFNKIDHIHTYGAAKVIMFFSWLFYSRIFGG